MSALFQWATRYPVRALAAFQAVLAAFTPVLPSGASAALLGVLTVILGLGVHQAVTPVASAAEAAAVAAAGAAELVARNLGPETVGDPGTAASPAGRVVDAAVAAVT